MHLVVGAELRAKLGRVLDNSRQKQGLRCRWHDPGRVLAARNFGFVAPSPPSLLSSAPRSRTLLGLGLRFHLPLRELPSSDPCTARQRVGRPGPLHSDSTYNATSRTAVIVELLVSLLT